MKTALSVLLSIFVTFPIFSQSLDQLQPWAKQKIDPVLQQSILAKERTPDQAVTSMEYHAAGTRAAAELGDMVGILVESSSDITRSIRSMGGTVGSRHGNIYTVLLPVAAIGKIAQQSSVQYVEASRPLFPSLDLSIAKTGADILHSLPDTSKRLTGKGVIIGFTDSGINTDHPNFKAADGRTRILYVWDQYSGGKPPQGFTYGDEEDSAAINAHTWSMYDEQAHGTHVAGIAAGNGLPGKTYVGMAPEADIITVVNRGDDLWNRGLTTVGTLDGYDYIRGKANALGKRFVINTSQGTNLGPHDGTTLFEKAINADVAAGSIIALAAGNEATSSRHASAVVTTSASQTIQCYLSEYGVTIPMDIWYGGNDRLALRIKESDDASYVTLFPPKDSTIVYAFDWVVVSVTTKIGSPLNGDNEIYITFRPFTGVSMDLQFSAASGNDLPDGGRVDLWWERNYNVQFVSHVDNSITFGIPAGADSAITVASFNNRSGFGSVDDISSFSGRGPRRDGVLKPDISAPGGMVMSSVPGGYDMFSGTSMSSPHVAGAVALLLQQDNTLTNYQVKRKLLASAATDLFTGPVPNPTWGYGKLNVLKAAGYRGFAILTLHKDTLDFGSVVKLSTKTDSVMISNLGNDDLNTSSITTSSGGFGVNRTSMVIGPRTMAALVVSATPADTGVFSGYVELVSDDTSHPVVQIALLGRGDLAPVAALSPDSMNVTLEGGEDTTRTLTLSNSGSGPLLYEIGINYLPQNPGALRTPARVPGLWGHVSDEISVRSGFAARFGTVGPLPLVLKDSVGDASEVDVSEIRGTSLGDSVVLQFVLATPIDRYEIGGYLGLDLDQNAATGSLIPAGLAGQDVGCEYIVTFFNLVGGAVLYDSSFTYVGTFPVVIDPSANTFTFSLPLALLNHDEGTINIAAVMGTQAIPTDWVPDVGHGTVGISWLTTNPSIGVVPSMGSMPISVHINAAYLSSGAYSAKLAVVTNDPVKSSIDVPLTLTVTTGPNLDVADSIKFATVYVGFADTVSVMFKNSGGTNLVIAGMTLDDAQFSFLDPTSFILVKGQHRFVRIRCNPSGVGIFSAHLTVSSNDADTPLLPIPLTGVAALAPVISLVPSDSIRATAGEGDTTVTVLTIRNTGEGKLYWQIAGTDDGSMTLQAGSMRTEAERKTLQQTAALSPGKNSGMPTVGLHDLKTLLSTSGSPRVLLWTCYADTLPGGEVENTMNAIRQFAPNASFQTTTTQSPSEFAVLLNACDVFIMPEQETIFDLSSLAAAFLPALTSFLQSGKTVVVLDYYTTGSTTFLNATGLLDINIVSLGEFTAVVHDIASPLVSGVPSTFPAMNGTNYHVSVMGKKIVRELFSGDNIVTERDLGAGRVIYIGMDFFSYNDAMARLLANAVTSSVGTIVSESPTHGEVEPGSSQDVQILFDARMLHVGNYPSVLTINNNDPVRNPRTLPVLLSVTGKPVISVAPDSIVGIPAYVALARKDTLWVTNKGSELLAVSGITSSDTSSFKLNKQSLYLIPGGRESVVVTTTRADTGLFRGQITFASNDASRPSVIAVLAGHTSYAPVLTVAPDSFTVTVDEGDSTTSMLTIGNLGLGELQWEIPHFEGSAIASLMAIRERIDAATIVAGKHEFSDFSLNQNPRTWIPTPRVVTMGAADTILIWSSGYNAPYWGMLTQMLEASGFTVIQTDLRPIQPSPSYVAIFTCEPLTPLEPSEVAALKNYVLSGGKVIDVGDSFYYEINPFLTEFGITRQYGGASGPVISSHPLFLDVGELTIDGSDWDNVLTVLPPSISIATCAGQTIAALGSDNRVLVFGEDSEFLDYALLDDDNIQLLQNVIMWIRSGMWLTGHPGSGSLATEQSQDITVQFNARNLSGGYYDRSITVYSNDPVRNPKSIPVHLEVIGRPHIRFIPDSVVGVTSYLNVPRTDTVRVRNMGSALLVVTGVTSNDTAAFQPGESTFYVLPYKEHALVITTAPKDTGLFRGVITVESNDPRNPTAFITVGGRTLYPPVLTSAPDSLLVTVNEGDTARRVLTIGNSGLGSLKWRLEGIEPSSSFPIGQVIPSAVVHTKAGQESSLRRWSKPAGQMMARKATVPGVGTSPATGGLLPIIIADPVGDAVRSDVAEVRGIVEDSVTIQIVLASTLNVNTFAGYLGLDADQNRTTGIALPFGAVGQDVGCEFILGLFDLTYGVYLYDQSGIIQALLPISIESFNRFSFCIPRWLLNNDDGIMNIAGVFGDQSGPTDWVPDAGHGVLGMWLYASSVEGTTPPGGSQNLDIILDARSMSGGSCRQSFRIVSNDPLVPTRNVPVSMTVVGMPRIVLTPDTITALTGYVGVARKDTLLVTNVGSVLLNVSSVSSSDTGMFKVDPAAFNLAGGSSKKLAVTSVFQQTGPFAGEISVVSNDAKHPTAKLVLSGVAVYPASISVKPDSFLIDVKTSIVLTPTDSVRRTLTISNSGLGALEWKMVGASAVSSSMAEPVPRTEEERQTVRKRQEQSGRHRTAPPTVGSYSINTLLSMTGTRHILLWTGLADTSEGAEVENTMNAIRQYSPDVSFELTRTFSPSEFAAKLNAADLFIMPAQIYSGNLSAMGTSFASALSSFVQNGKTAIVLDYWNYDTLNTSTAFLNATKLLDIRLQGYGSYFNAEVFDAASPLVIGVAPVFVAMDGTNFHASPNGMKVIREQSSGGNIVTLRTVGAGRVVYFGMDFWSYNRDMARLLSNAVASSQGSFMTASSTSGSIIPGRLQDLTVDFISRNLPAGTYVTSLIIYSNDPLRSAVVVPVWLKKTIVGVEDVTELPSTFALRQNYPNPFNPHTTIAYDLPRTCFVTLKIYNLVGQEVATITEEVRQAGRYRDVWDAGGFASGIYFCRMTAETFTQTTKLILIK